MKYALEDERLRKDENLPQCKQIVLSRQDLDIVQTFARHCNAIAKKVKEDEKTGSKRYIYIRLKPEDHFRLANR